MKYKSNEIIEAYKYNLLFSFVFFFFLSFSCIFALNFLEAKHKEKKILIRKKNPNS